MKDLSSHETAKALLSTLEAPEVSSVSTVVDTMIWSDNKSKYDPIMQTQQCLPCTRLVHQMFDDPFA